MFECYCNGGLMKQMNPLWFAVGILLTIIGVAFLGISNLSRYSDPVPIVKVGVFRVHHEEPSSNTTWIEEFDNSTSEISANFSRGEHLLFYFTPGDKWGEPPYSYPSFKFVIFEVCSQQGNTTDFFIQLYVDQKTGMISLFNLTSVNKGALIIDNSTNGVVVTEGITFFGGIVRYCGRYTVKFLGIMGEPGSGLATSDLPNQFWLYKRYEYRPLQYFLPIGGVIAVTGLALIVKQRKYSKGTRKHRKMKINKTRDNF